VGSSTAELSLLRWSGPDPGLPRRNTAVAPDWLPGATVFCPGAVLVRLRRRPCGGAYGARPWCTSAPLGHL